MDYNSIEKFFCLDVFYCIMSFFLVLLSFEQWNLLDIMYLCILSYYYIRIKLNRKKSS